MIYFSEVFGTDVFDQHHHYIGKLRDFYFIPIETPVITKFVLRNNKKEDIILPIQNLKKNGRGFIVESNDIKSEEIKENEVSVLKNVQDQQIIDIKGAKIIRANDVIIQDSPRYTLSGIDIGIFGVFRWIRLAKLIADMLRRFNIQYKSEFLPWSDVQPLEIAKGKRIVLKEEKAKMRRLPPEDLADYLERSNTINVLKVLRLLDSQQAADVIADINTTAQTKLFHRIKPEKAANILALIDPDEAVDILLSLRLEKRKEILDSIAEPNKQDIVHLMHLSKTPIGHLMSSKFITVLSDITVRRALDEIKKKTRDYSNMFYLFIQNSNNQLIGVISIHDLLMQNMDDPLYKVMNQNVVTIRLTTPKEIAVQKMLKYHLYAVPVIDDNRIMIGIVSLNNASEDIIESQLEA